jgi:hypothetical protein
MEEYGSSKRWIDLKAWRFDGTGASNSTTGKIIDIPGASAGRKVQIVYTVEPESLQNGNNYNLTGLPEWSREVVVMGACWRVASFIESANLVSGNTDRFSVGQQTNLAKYFLGMYNTLLTEAEARQRLEFPVRRHYVY